MNDKKNIPELLKDWKWVKLEVLCDKVSLNGIKIKQKDYIEEGIYPVVDQGKELVGGYYNDERLVIPGEPPYVVFGDHTRVKKFVNFKFIAGADGLKVLKAKSIVDPKFLYYSLFVITIEDKGYARHFQLLEKELFALPPLSIQQAIVSKIEELFSELDKGIENLRLAQQQLKTYRQSVLKWAFEGKLTKDNVKDGKLPEGWKWMKVQDFKKDVLNSICAGPFGTIFKAKDFRNTGIPIIFLRHVKAGYYNTQKPGFMDEKVWEKLFKPYSVFGGELLITKLGDPPGECTIYPSGIGPAMVTPDVIKMNVDETLIIPKFLMYYFNSDNSRKALQDIAFGTTRLRITLPIFKNLPVPYCPLEEQHLIVQAIESRLSVADKLEESITQSLQQAEALRQSILKKAFEGKLI